MGRYLVIYLMLSLGVLSQIWSQTIPILVTDWRMLNLEYQITSELLKTSTQDILNLEKSLKQANDSGEILSQKILDLKDSLAIAKGVQKVSQKRIVSLLILMSELKLSLTSTRLDLIGTIEKHTESIKKLVVGYETKMKLSSLLLKIVIIVIIAETGYIIADNLL